MDELEAYHRVIAMGGLRLKRKYVYNDGWGYANVSEETATTAGSPTGSVGVDDGDVGEDAADA